jgi:FemAB-related protein (PEP-CTERM system-associated)
MIFVRTLDDQKENRVQWSDFVENHCDACLDHCWEWRWVLKEAFGYQPYYLGAFEDGRLAGILPLFHVPLGFGRYSLVSIPFGNYGGICADSSKIAAALIEETSRLMERLNCSHATFFNRKTIQSDRLISRDEKARYSLALKDVSLEHIFAGLHGSVRKKFRQAVKHGLTFERSRDTGALYEMHIRKFHQLGTPCFPKSYFDLILKHFNGRTFIYYVCFENKPVAFKFCFDFRGSLVMLVGGDLKEYLNLHPNYFLFWKAMEDAKSRGCYEFDMGRSSRNSGPAQHKLFLGMNESPLGYQYLFSGEHKFALRTTGSHRFQLASQVWRRLPLSMTKIIGPQLVRYFA